MEPLASRSWLPRNRVSEAVDGFFHNVFSMFDGKRFDLGLIPAPIWTVQPPRDPVVVIVAQLDPPMPLQVRIALDLAQWSERYFGSRSPSLG